jgi:hypothetical protein
MRNKKKLIWIAPLAIAAMVLFVWLGGELVMRLWNWLLPSLFGWRTITFWQGLGLLALCRILFGGLCGQGGHRGGFRRKVRDRWEGMTPEEREKWRDAFQRHWGKMPPSDSTPAA